MDNSRKKPLSLLVRLKKISGPVSFVVGIIALIVQFIELWRGDREVITWMTTLLVFTLLLILLIWVAFSKINVSDILIVPSNYKTRQMRYPKWYKVARVTLILLILSVIVLGTLLFFQYRTFANKVIILVADFEGPDPKNYRLTEQILFKLKDSLVGYPDIIIRSLNQVITEQDGSELARTVGERYQADIVIWGWYGVTSSDVIITAHIENLSNLDLLSFGIEDSQYEQEYLPLSDIESFQLQQELSSDLTYLIYFVGGVAQYEARDYDAAIKLFNVVNESKNKTNYFDTAIFMFYRGTSLAKAGQPLSAIQDYNVAIMLAPNFANAYYNRGLEFVVLGNYQNAHDNFTKVIELKPNDPLAYINRCATSTHLGQINDAIDDCNKAIEIDSADPYAYSNLGNAYAYLTKYEDAIKYYSKAISMSPKNARIYANRSTAYQKIGEYEKAIVDLTSAIHYGLNTAESYSIRGALYSIIGKHKLAIRDLDKAIELDPNYSDAYQNRGTVYSKIDEYEKAILDFNTVVAFDPSNIDAYLGRGYAFQRLRDYNSAIADYSKVIEFDPTNAMAYSERAYVYLSDSVNNDKNFYKQAIDDSTEAIKLNPELDQPYFTRGDAYAILGQKQLAKADFKKFLEISTNSSQRKVVEDALKSLGTAP